MGDDKKHSASSDRSVSSLHRGIGQVALALIIAFLIWIGSTVYSNSMDLSVLKSKMFDIREAIKDLKK